MRPWIQVRKELGVRPVSEGQIGGEAPLYAEHYLFRAIEKAVSGQHGVALVSQLGGARIQEGESGHPRTVSLPSQSTLIPAGCATHWHYAGAADFAVFYLPDDPTGVADRLRLLSESRSEPLPFSDPLVSAAALQLVNELQKGRGADQGFMGRLAGVMLEQAYRVLTIPGVGGISPRHAHYAMLQAVLNHVREHPGADLSNQVLAKLANLSLAHFRRLFHEAMGVPPHSYVLSARLEQARNLLTMTAMPISRIAGECGFSSQSHLTACFRAAHAATPAEYRAHVARGTEKD